MAEPFEQYVERLQRDGEWGDHIEIQAMSEIYDRPVEIYAYGIQPMRTFKGPHNHDRPLRLSYHFASHYNSIVDERSHARSVVTSMIPSSLERTSPLANTGAFVQAPRVFLKMIIYVDLVLVVVVVSIGYDTLRVSFGDAHSLSIPSCVIC
jgi:hypothetical protein